MNRPSFGPRLRAAREKAGLTQTELAERADSTKNTVARLERGEQKPSFELAAALAKALKVSVAVFE